MSVECRPAVSVVEGQRELARDRQGRQQPGRAGEAIDESKRFCLACKAQFQPKLSRSWFCSRRCIDRVSWHRKQARIAEAAAMNRDHRQSAFGITNPLTLEDLRRRWREAPQKNEVHYRLWFPDLCNLSPEQAIAERKQFQADCHQQI
jgi:hypothetical protein